VTAAALLENARLANKRAPGKAARLLQSPRTQPTLMEDTMTVLTRAASERTWTSSLAATVAVVVGWLLLSGLFFAGITRPVALDSSIERILAGSMAREPAPETMASTTVIGDKLCACNTRTDASGR